jgi:hypothetical protein
MHARTHTPDVLSVQANHTCNTHHENGEHDLGHVEGMPPVVVRDISVVPLDRDQETVQRLQHEHFS